MPIEDNFWSVVAILIFPAFNDDIVPLQKAAASWYFKLQNSLRFSALTEINSGRIDVQCKQWVKTNIKCR